MSEKPQNIAVSPEDEADALFEGEFGGEKVVAQAQWRLIIRRFKRHKLAVLSFWVLCLLYFVGVLFPEFFSPYDRTFEFDEIYLPPQGIHFFDSEGEFHLRPFVYGLNEELDPDTWETKYTPDPSRQYSLRFFVRGLKYKLWGLIPADLHFFGVDEGGQISLFGTDNLGRDQFSRTLYGARVSLTIGFVGVFISLTLGLLLGGLSGLLGGFVDNAIQRVIETLLSIPKLPLWMALAAAIPRNWSALQVYFAITVILSLMGWTGLARVVRSKFISLREEDFVTAARGYNTPTSKIILRHLIPNFVSYIIVNMTLAIPDMILAETALSFLGIGLRAPVVSFGVLLERAQKFQTVSLYPFLLIPGLLVVVVVLGYNFVGDGLRDAADPYK